MPSPSWRQSGACDVHHSHMHHQCQPWKEKERVLGYNCSTHARPKVARLRQGSGAPEDSSPEYGARLSSKTPPGPVGGPEGRGYIWMLCRSQKTGKFESPASYIKTQQCRDKLR